MFSIAIRRERGEIGGDCSDYGAGLQARFAVLSRGLLISGPRLIRECVARTGVGGTRPRTLQFALILILAEAVGL